MITEAERIMRNLIVLQGLSYVEAIRYCDRQAVAAAAPYHEVAGRLRDELAKNEDGSPSSQHVHDRSTEENR